MIALPVALGGCAGALVVGGLAAAAGGGYAAGQERGVNGVASDFEIKGNIEQAMIKADPQLQSGIATTVYGGRVLLTGRVANPQLKAEAEQVAGRVPGVRTLYDDLAVAPPEVAWNDAKDAWITTRVRSQMILDPGIRSINYTIDTADGSVYLMGSARSQAELDRATRIARYVPGVRRVVSYVVLRGGGAVAATPAPPPEASFGPAPAGAAPQGRIEVQKL
ncbi:MAG TPA: BON domain-containing protein [Stellaceae bacterium]|nr:BON domain-containing protein [Stellaceae bacterium]